MFEATYARLKNGSWGAKVKLGTPDAVRPKNGDTLKVTKKDGSTKEETVSWVVCAFDDSTLCALQSQDAQQPPRDQGGQSKPATASAKPAGAKDDLDIPF
jgi:hypothetical protein